MKKITLVASTAMPQVVEDVLQMRQLSLVTAANEERSLFPEDAFGSVDELVYFCVNELFSVFHCFVQYGTKNKKSCDL